MQSSSGMGKSSIMCAIEAKVRKQDEALIRQMLEALEKVDQAMPFPVARQEITAARARLAPVLHSTGKEPS